MKQFWTTSFSQPFSPDTVGLQVFGTADPQVVNSKLKLPVVVYFHGGLFNCGSIEDAYDIAQVLVDEMIVVCVDYPLAPELHFPATVEIAFEAAKWVWRHAAKLGIDKSRVFVAGDQAGGNLAAAVAMMVRDRTALPDCQLKLRGQLMINPMLDARQTTKSIGAADCPCRQGWIDYLPRFSDALHPYASPANSLRLGGLASALIITGELEPLRDEAEEYARNLIAAGIPVQVRRLKGAKGDLVKASHPDFARVIQTVQQFISDAI